MTPESAQLLERLAVALAIGLLMGLERGWEYQYALLEARLEAKGAQNAALPGTIVTSPFEDVVPYRSDGTARNARKNVKTSGRATNDGVSHF